MLVHLRLSMSMHARRTLDVASVVLDIKKKSLLWFWLSLMGRLQFRSIQWIGYAGQKIVLPAKLPCHVFMLRLLSFLFFMSTPISFLNPSGVVICRYADDIILFLKDDKYVGNFKSTRLKQWLG